jgi:type II secretory pathway pseudopilin PulG
MHRIRRAASLGTAALALAACDSVTDSLLDAPDPDLIDPSTTASAEAADALRIGAVARLRVIGPGGEGAWLLGGLMTDEWKSSDTFSQRNETDRRQVQESNGNVQTMYRNLHRTRNSAREALDALRKYKPTPTANLGQMYFVLGFAELTLAENFCNGQPLSDASTGEVIYGSPMTNQEIFTLALAHFDSALTLSSASDAFATEVRRSSAVARGRTLLNLNRHADAATAVTSVPTNFQLLATFSLTGGNNQIWALNASAKRWTVGDSFDVSGRIQNAIPFASAKDPRVPVTGTATGTSPAGRGFDGSTNFIILNTFGRTDPTPIVSGLDARLIEAEARLKANDIAGMMSILNALRAAPQSLGPISTPVMTALATPSTQDAAINLYFREKAFWTFSRGQRLPDLRRLIRQYGRTESQVFPEGTFFKGGPYENDVDFPVTIDELNNPNFQACANRSA